MNETAAGRRPFLGRAKALYDKDTSYVVKDNEIIIVDEFTGRLQPGLWRSARHARHAVRSRAPC